MAGAAPLLPTLLSGGLTGGISSSETDNSVFVPTTNQSGGSQNIQKGAASMLEPFTRMSQLGGGSAVGMLVVFGVFALILFLILRKR